MLIDYFMMKQKNYWNSYLHTGWLKRLIRADSNGLMILFFSTTGGVDGKGKNSNGLSNIFLQKIIDSIYLSFTGELVRSDSTSFSTYRVNEYWNFLNGTDVFLTVLRPLLLCLREVSFYAEIPLPTVISELLQKGCFGILLLRNYNYFYEYE